MMLSIWNNPCTSAKEILHERVAAENKSYADSIAYKGPLGERAGGAMAAVREDLPSAIAFSEGCE